MATKSLLDRSFYFFRNMRSGKLFTALARYVRGDVLDVGGYDFYLTAKSKKIRFKTWTTLEVSKKLRPKIRNKDFNFVIGDGCAMKFKDNSFNTVLNIQVLEHVFEPLLMVKEIARVLKNGGHAVFLIPQTSTIHMAPYHYYNFTKYWVKKAAQKYNLKIIEDYPLGGVWSSMASHLTYFFFQLIKFKGMTDKENKRNIFTYVLSPLMILYALVSLPICLFFALGDLSEEPNNHLVVVKKV